MIKWTSLAPWEFEFPFPGSLTSTFLVCSSTRGSQPIARARNLRPAPRRRSGMLSLQSFLRKGVSLGYVGLNLNLNELNGGTLSFATRISATSPWGERLVIYCQTTSASAAHATHCATYCTLCRPLVRAFSGWGNSETPRSATE